MPRLVAETVSFDAPGGKVSGYLVRLKEKGKRPAVLVIHENRGLNPHIKDVARRLALEGFLAYGVDLLSTSGGTPTDEDKGRDMFGKLNLRRDREASGRRRRFPEEASGIDAARWAPSASAGAVR